MADAPAVHATAVFERSVDEIDNSLFNSVIALVVPTNKLLFAVIVGDVIAPVNVEPANSA